MKFVRFQGPATERLSNCKKCALRQNKKCKRKKSTLKQADLEKNYIVRRGKVCLNRNKCCELGIKIKVPDIIYLIVIRHLYDLSELRKNSKNIPIKFQISASSLRTI